MEVVIYSGNILGKALSLSKGGESGNDEELFESLRTALSAHPGPLTPENGNILEVFPLSSSSPSLPAEEPRSDLKVTSKLFLYSLERSHIENALNAALRGCGEPEFLDSLVISFSCGAGLTLPQVLEAWTVLEEQVKGGRVRTIGVADVDTPLFLQLWEEAQVKPGIVQINLASCCVVPPELAEFCKGHGIQLLTHKDSLDVLPRPKARELASLLPEGEWSPLWVIRVQVHLKTRGVLATKAYVGSLSTTTTAPATGENK